MLTDTDLQQAFLRCVEMEASLEGRLRSFATALARLEPNTAAAYDTLIARLKRAEAGSSAPRPGEPMPPFCLPDETGRLVTLDDLLAEGPAAIVFHRGHWCPYCRMNTFALARAQGAIAAAGGTIVAVMPDRRRFARALQAEAGATFPILTDFENGYAMSLNLVFWIGEEMEGIMTKAGIDVPDVTATRSWLLPIPATFVVGQGGIVHSRFVDPDFRRRLEMNDLVAAIADAR
jgi:peroxiredoxin